MDVFLENLVLVPRVMWGAKKPRAEKEIDKTPVPNLLFYHDHKTRCSNKIQCTETIRNMQEKHMNKGESDIIYHYVVTIDGTVYEGRNTKSIGRIFPDSNRELRNLNNQSIIIGCLDNGVTSPPSEVLVALMALTEKLRRDGVIDQNVKLKIYLRDGHPQKRMQLKENKDIIKYMK